MDQNAKNTLVSTSKIIILALRILFVLLILLAIVPWLIPNTGTGRFFLSIFQVLNFSNAEKNLSSLSLLSRILGIIGSLVSLLPLFTGIVIMMKLTKNYVAGKIFNSTNATYYKTLGITYLLSAILLQPLSQIFFSLSISINNPAGQHFIAFGIDISNLTAIFFAIMLIIIGRVMRLGQKISEEQELTI